MTIASGGGAAAQWSSDPLANLPLADRSGEQVQAKIKPILAGPGVGGSYVSWFDNATGGYDVYLQRLDGRGIEQWLHNGVLVADRSFSSTQDYGLAVNAPGEALLAFRDDRSGAVHITAQRIDPAGNLLWPLAATDGRGGRDDGVPGGGGGVQVTINANAANSPRIAAASDDHAIVGWSEASGIRLQRLNAQGQTQWIAGGIGLAPATGAYSLSDLVASDDGSVIALWVHATGGFSSPRYLYAQKFSSSGAAMWNGGQPVVVFDGTSVQIAYFPTFVSDGAGGAVFAWYETGSPRNCYVQRIDGNGAEVFAHNGVAVSVGGVPGNIRLSPSVAFDASSGESYVFWVEANSVQSMWGLHGQKLSAAGARQWSDAGKVIVPLSGNQVSFVNSLTRGDGSGAMVFCIDRSGPAQIVGAHLNAAGDHLWPDAGVTPICATLSSKSRLAATLNSCGHALLAWGDGRNDSGDIYAQNVRNFGALGNQRPGDATGDNIVNVNDLLAIINSWNNCPAQGLCPADVAPFASCEPGDGVVNVNDLLMCINNWG